VLGVLREKSRIEEGQHPICIGVNAHKEIILAILPALRVPIVGDDFAVASLVWGNLLPAKLGQVFGDEVQHDLCRPRAAQIIIYETLKKSVLSAPVILYNAWLAQNLSDARGFWAGCEEVHSA
jgi:hypothetical protein